MNIGGSRVVLCVKRKFVNISEFLDVLLFKLYLGISLHLIEENKELKRRMETLMLAYQGPVIKIDDVASQPGREIKTLVHISQNLQPERDMGCTNYPNDHYNSYKDCDEDYLLKEVKLRRNVTPVWATEDLEAVTKLHHVDESEILMSYFFEGYLVSSCLMPCVSTMVRS